ncbi:hypothetical protein SO802_028957 [Lithocarpus litseifolius]|uniref:Uncharacterized protein n=1 Tax=Lithocarpus litseifolius TaxID=425828 RepID=A0AAW2BSQ5_9ROSI
MGDVDAGVVTEGGTSRDGPPPEANPLAQSSSSVEAQPADTLACTTGSTSRNTSGTTSGIAVWALIKKTGKLPVRIATKYVALVGENS